MVPALRLASSFRMSDRTKDADGIHTDDCRSKLEELILAKEASLFRLVLLLLP